eukprot:4148230-Amphidinium_carterae.2
MEIDGVMKDTIVEVSKPGTTTLVIAMYTSLRLCQQQLKQQTREQSTQYTKTPKRKIDATRVRESQEGEGFTQVGVAGQLQVPGLELDAGPHHYEMEKK